MTHRYACLRVCERLGVRLRDLEQMGPDQLAELLAYEEIRQEEERRTWDVEE